MKIVVIESPFAGCFPLNRAYLAACIRDCLRRGETPYASHGLIPWALDDTDPEQRRPGLEAGQTMTRALLQMPSARMVVYEDLGVSSGMGSSISKAVSVLAGVEWRTIKATDWAMVARDAENFDLRFKRIMVTDRGLNAFGCYVSPSDLRTALQAAGQIWVKETSNDEKSKAARGWYA